ncbi:MAG: HDOD domain-containing protein [Methyloprofundus sp.]|nr:HDOD domain-containing protein [Methyloprofundus sp.]
MVRLTKSELKQQSVDRYLSTKRFLGGVDIPTVPKVINDLRDVFSRKFVNILDVARIIESNNVIAGEFIHAVNSGRFFDKPKCKISKVKDGLILSGGDNPELVDFITTLAMKNAFPDEVKDPSFHEMMEYCSDVAYLCKEISDEMIEIDKIEAYIFGLFVDCGYLLLNKKNTAYFNIFTRSRTQPRRALDMEYKMGADHASAGFLMAKEWSLPNWIQGGILFHNVEMGRDGSVLSEKTQDMVSVYWIASYILNEISYGGYITQEYRDEYKRQRDRLDLSEIFLSQVRKTFIIDKG